MFKIFLFAVTEAGAAGFDEPDSTKEVNGKVTTQI